MLHKPIIIVGGGPVGMTCALILAKQGIAVTILECGHSKQNDGRVLALSYSSVATLIELNAWDKELATAINEVHISHSGLGVSNINSNDVNLPQLGYTIKYSDLCKKLKQQINTHSEINWQSCIVEEVIPGENFSTLLYDNGNKILTTELAILAEGGKIKIKDVEYRDYDYDQMAITAEISAQKKHTNIAYERFDNSGASVFLPHGKNFVLVWSLPKDEAQNIIKCKNLIEHLQNLSFMKRFGKIELAGDVFSFPLKLQVAKNKVLDRVVLIGNSAQIVHPISAQGMNLAIRDIVTLCELIADGYIDSKELADYDKKRSRDAKFVIGFTHNLAKFIDKDTPGISHLRGAGIMALSNCKPLQNIIANSLIFGA